jgi:hypothetical protein
MSKFVGSLVRFHADEEGNEALQTVAVLAVGATVLVGLLAIWTGTVKPRTQSWLDQVLGTAK